LDPQVYKVIIESEIWINLLKYKNRFNWYIENRQIQYQAMQKKQWLNSVK
jgi:hypothetical protein